MATIHYHSDANFFSGAENMMVNFLSSKDMREKFKISFSYRYSKRYAEGLANRLKLEVPVYPMHLYDPSNVIHVPEGWFGFLKRWVSFISRVIFSIPIVILDFFILYNLFRKIRPDILHVNNAGYPASLSARIAVISAKLSGVGSIVMVVNNMAADYSRPSRWINYPLDRLVANYVTRFITGSSAASMQLQKVLRLDGGKCLVIHNGIDVREITESREDTLNRLGLVDFNGVIFGVVAILRQNKGHEVLLKSFLQILSDTNNCLPNIKILIEGDGPLRDKLRRIAVVNNLVNHCQFVGNESNVINFISCLDVLVLPSTGQEDFPNVVLEAMALSKPVIASRISGVPEQVVSEVTGLMVAPCDVDELASAISTLAIDAPRRVQMGESGMRRFQEHFTAHVALKYYQLLYMELVERNIK